MKPIWIREFQSSPWMKAFVIGACVSTAALAIAAFSELGLSAISLILLTLSAVFAAGVLDAFTSYLKVADESIEIRYNLRRRTFSRDSIDQVHQSARGAISLRQRDGIWIELPASLTGNSQDTTGILRAWLRHGTDKPAVEVDEACH